jgi:hypothetical protein
MPMSRITIKAAFFYCVLILGFLSLVTGFILYLWPQKDRRLSSTHIDVQVGRRGGDL